MDICPIYKAESKTVLHLVRDCERVIHIWRSIGDLEIVSFFIEDNIKN